MTHIAAGGIGILFVSAVPAMYRLDLLSPLPKQDIGKLIAVTVCAGFFGVFFVIPLRKYYIVKQKLTFPTPAATAVTIRALHNSRTGAMVARKKSLALLYAFIACFSFKVLSGYAPGVVSIHTWLCAVDLLFATDAFDFLALRLAHWLDALPDWLHEHYLYGQLWLVDRVCVCIFNANDARPSCRFPSLVTPAFFGAGMLSGLNASWSFCELHICATQLLHTE